MLKRVAELDAKLADRNSLEYRVAEYLEDGKPRTIRQIVEFLNFAPDLAQVQEPEASRVTAAMSAAGYILADVKYVRWWQVWRWRQNHRAAYCLLRIAPELLPLLPESPDEPDLYWPG